MVGRPLPLKRREAKERKNKDSNTQTEKKREKWPRTYDTGTNLDQGSASLEWSRFDKYDSTCKHTNFYIICI